MSGRLADGLASLSGRGSEVGGLLGVALCGEPREVDPRVDP